MGPGVCMGKVGDCKQQAPPAIPAPFLPWRKSQPGPNGLFNLLQTNQETKQFKAAFSLMEYKGKTHLHQIETQ